MLRSMRKDSGTVRLQHLRELNPSPVLGKRKQQPWFLKKVCVDERGKTKEESLVADENPSKQFLDRKREMKNRGLMTSNLKSVQSSSFFE